MASILRHISRSFNASRAFQESYFTGHWLTRRPLHALAGIFAGMIDAVRFRRREGWQ